MRPAPRYTAAFRPMDIEARHLVFHSAVVLLAGLLVGAPYGRAINRRAPDEVVRAWRLAHGALPLGAALGFAIAAVLSALSVGAPTKALIAWAWIASNYGFCVALPLAALVGQRASRRRSRCPTRSSFSATWSAPHPRWSAAWRCSTPHTCRCDERE